MMRSSEIPLEGVEALSAVPPELVDDVARIARLITNAEDRIADYAGSTNPDRFSLLSDLGFAPLTYNAQLLAEKAQDLGGTGAVVAARLTSALKEVRPLFTEPAGRGEWTRGLALIASAITPNAAPEASPEEATPQQEVEEPVVNWQEVVSPQYVTPKKALVSTAEEAPVFTAAPEEPSLPASAEHTPARIPVSAEQTRLFGDFVSMLSGLKQAYDTHTAILAIQNTATPEQQGLIARQIALAEEHLLTLARKADAKLAEIQKPLVDRPDTDPLKHHLTGIEKTLDALLFSVPLDVEDRIKAITDALHASEALASQSETVPEQETHTIPSVEPEPVQPPTPQPLVQEQEPSGPLGVGRNPVLESLSNGRPEKDPASIERLFGAVTTAVEERDRDITARNLERGTAALKLINDAIAKYKALPRAVKWTITAGVIGVGVGASMGAGMTLPAALVAVLSKRALNLLVGTAAGFAASKTLEKAIDVGMDAATSRWGAWFNKYPEATKFIRELPGVVGAGAGIGAGIAVAGMMPTADELGHALSGAKESVSSVGLDEIARGETVEGGRVAGGEPETTEQQETKAAPQQPRTDIDTPDVPSEKVERGETVWSMIREDMETRPDLKEAFEKLTPEEQNAAIDRVENKLQSLTPEEVERMGIASGDIDRLAVGETVNLDSVLTQEDLSTAIADNIVDTEPAPQPTETPSAPSEVALETAPSLPETTPQTVEGGWSPEQKQAAVTALVDFIINPPRGGWTDLLFGASTTDATAIGWLYGASGEPAGINGTTVENLLRANPEGPYSPQSIESVRSLLTRVTEGTGIDVSQANWQQATVEEVVQAALSRGMEVKTPWFTEFLGSKDAQGVRTLLGG